MKIKLAFTLGLLLFTLIGSGQNSILDVNFEFQAYPTGLIPGVRLEKSFAEKNAVHLRLGYQMIDHGDQGKHDDETGSGYGFTLGYKRYLKDGFKGLHLGIRSDVWFNTIDWVSIEEPAAGTTEIVVLQPTAEAGWLFNLGKNFILAPTLAFGFEINVKTKDQPTGEGTILLLGLQAGYRF